MVLSLSEGSLELYQTFHLSKPGRNNKEKKPKSEMLVKRTKIFTLIYAGNPVDRLIVSFELTFANH